MCASQPSLDFLNSQVSRIPVRPEIPVGNHLEMARRCLEQAGRYRAQGDRNNHYVLQYRGVRFFIETIPSHPRFDKNDTGYKKLLEDVLNKYLPELEKMKDDLRKRRFDWDAGRASTAAPSAGTPQASDALYDTPSNQLLSMNLGRPASSELPMPSDGPAVGLLDPAAAAASVDLYQAAASAPSKPVPAKYDLTKPKEPSYPAVRFDKEFATTKPRPVTSLGGTLAAAEHHSAEFFLAVV